MCGLLFFGLNLLLLIWTERVQRIVCIVVKMAESVPLYFSIFAFFCTAGAIALAVFHIYRHLMNYTEPTYQRYIVRIIFMVPVSDLNLRLWMFMVQFLSRLVVVCCWPYMANVSVLCVQFLKQSISHINLVVFSGLCIDFFLVACFTGEFNLFQFNSGSVSSPHPHCNNMLKCDSIHG